MQVYYDKDAALGRIQEKTVGIVGFGSQGHAHALNLKDSGVRVLVGLPEGSKSRPKAMELGFEVVSPSELARRADVVMLLTPDERMSQMYDQDIAPNIKQGAYLAFAHGFNIHYGYIKPFDGLNVFMVAPKAPGHLLRREFQAGRGVPSLVAVHADPARDTLEVALAYACAIGSGRSGILKTSFKDETETDLFGEQAVLCGGLSSLIQAGFETLTEAGYPPEMAYFECLHEIKLIVDLVYEGGISNMRYSISNTAEYGDMTRGPRIIDAHVKENMKRVLQEVQDGSFAKEWVEEYRSGQKHFLELRNEAKAHLIEEVGKRLRSMMGWMSKEKLL